MDWRSFSSLILGRGGRGGRNGRGGCGSVPGADRGSRGAGRVALVVVVMVVGLGLGLTGCGKQAVRASEKELLADQVMIFDHDSQETAADEHIMTNREGSAGGRGAAGGGCGCN